MESRGLAQGGETPINATGSRALRLFTLRLPRSAAPNGYGMKSTKEEATRAVSGCRPARSGGGEPIFTWKRRPARGRELLLDDSHCFS